MSTKSELLSAYAAGETSPGLSLLCATQASIDPESAALVSLAEEVAGHALRDEAPGPSMDVEAMMARLDEVETESETSRPAAQAASTRSAHCPLPAVLRRAAGGDVASLPWRFRWPGLSEHILPEFEGEKVSLLRGKPGSRILQHTHKGMEATLVLQGALKDGDRVLERGEMSLCGADHDHHPEIVGDETCYCLIVVDGKLRFTGTFGRALNLF